MHSDSPITGHNIGDGQPLDGAPAPEEAGAEQSVALPAGVKRYVALRALDEQDNPGRTASLDRLPGSGGSGGSLDGLPGAGVPGAGAPGPRGPAFREGRG